MIKNIVFDIGNVFVTFEPIKHFITYFKDEEKTKQLCNKIFQHDAWSKYDQGIYFMEDLRRVYKAEYPNDWEDITYILEHWLSLMTFMPATYSYAKELKQRGFHTYLLSNISKESADYLKQTMPFFNEIKEGVLSYEVKINKPSVEIYQHLLNKYHLKAEETIFLDDNFANVEQANKLGIHALVFTTIDCAIQDVEQTIRSIKTC